MFGAGGDRDTGKRPIMGRIAHDNADRVIDHRRQSAQRAARGDPRRHSCAKRRAAIEIGDRAQAIRAGIAELKSGDVLLIAGKGHETGQLIAGKTLPFSDHEAVAKALQETSHDRALDHSRHGRRDARR